jgi:hypothetical protein
MLGIFEDGDGKGKGKGKSKSKANPVSDREGP